MRRFHLASAVAIALIAGGGGAAFLLRPAAPGGPASGAPAAPAVERRRTPLPRPVEPAVRWRDGKAESIPAAAPAPGESASASAPASAPAAGEGMTSEELERDAEAIARFLARLSGASDSLVKHDATAGIAALRSPDATEALITIAMGGDDVEKRRFALAALGTRKDARTVEWLRYMTVSEGEVLVRAEAALALGQTGKADPRELASFLRGEPESAVRRALARSLARDGGPEAARALLEAAREPTADRTDVFASLAGLENQAAAPALLDAARTELDPGVLAACATALGRCGGEAAVEPLGRLLGADRPADVRLAAASSLGMVGLRSGIPHLQPHVGEDALGMAARQAIARIELVSSRAP